MPISRLQWQSGFLQSLAIPPNQCGSLDSVRHKEIFAAARQANAILMTKDGDFAEMVERLGSPPAVIWLTCGNTSNAALRVILKPTLPKALELIGRGEKLVEISGSNVIPES